MTESTQNQSEKRSHRWLPIAIALCATGIAIWVIFDIHGHLKSDQLSVALRSISNLHLFFAAAATVCSFVVLALMEYLGAKSTLGYNIPLRRATFYSLIIYGISNTFGVAGLASTPLRLRLYGADKAEANGILSLCLLASVAFWLGLAYILGATLIASAMFESSALPFTPLILATSGFIVLFAALMTGWFLAGRGTKLFGKLQLKFPGKSQIFAQSFLAALDWLLAGIALYSLIPKSSGSQFFGFLSGFFVSQIAALISSVPGGIGVLESFNLYIMHPPEGSIHEIAAAFIAYRSIYYIPPLLISFLLFAAWSFRRAQGTFAQAAHAVVQYGQSSVPFLSASFAGTMGLALLLNSGHAFTWIEHWSGLSAFSESLVGTALLILAMGLFERSSSARKLTMVVSSALAIAATASGPSYAALTSSLALLIVLAGNERAFYRKSELSTLKDQQRFSVLVLLPTLASMTLAIFAFYRHELDTQQWWKFTFDENASGILRGCVGSLVTLGAYGLWALLAPRGRPGLDLNGKEQQASQVTQDVLAIETSPFTTSWLALVGDKEHFRVEGIDGFIMYKIARPFWIAMGEPVCAPDQLRTLVAAFLADCDQHGGVPVFYQTRPETLSKYVEIGFQAVKIGEEARVWLQDFSLEGRDRKSMRNTCNRIEREGYKFAIISRDSVSARLADLREVSDQWLANLSMREKGFSIGYFNDNYIQSSDVAVIMKDEKIVAFANLWVSRTKEEFSVDLMRYSTHAPSGIMEYLIIQIILHAKSDSYKWFNLGMAPLAGLEGIHSGRQWHRVGTMIYRAGEAFYNFRGLKAFKDKFGPTWESRFLVYPPGSNLARILSSTAVLINFKGVKRTSDYPSKANRTTTENPAQKRAS